MAEAIKVVVRFRGHEPVRILLLIDFLYSKTNVLRTGFFRGRTRFLSAKRHTPTTLFSDQSVTRLVILLSVVNLTV